MTVTDMVERLPEVAGKPHRRGHPAPLIFHLCAAITSYQAAVAGAPAAAEEAFPWHPDITPPSQAPAPLAVAEAALARLRQAEEGIRAWQQHPYQRPETVRPVLWQAGSTRLLDYGGAGPVVLVVPSLINSADILDLTPNASFLAALSAKGLRPVLLDWGAPERAEAGLDLGQYIAGRLLPAWMFLEGWSGRRPPLLGYCMGGSLVAALAATMPGAPGLVTIGAPWSFAGGTGLAAEIRLGARQMGAAKLDRIIDGLTAAFGLVPAATFQHLFALVDPMQAARKFRAFAAMPQDGKAAERFVALEDWLADGRAMSGPATRDLLVRWQIADALDRGDWHCLGRAARPEEIHCPAMVVTGLRDHIATSATTRPLTRRLPAPLTLETGLGHVGMVVSRNSRREVVDPVVAFLSALP
ncbi:alpha/beta hydrolase [Algicella marina]|uniref:Alpha/beta hydrolase n=1 Tax=Algicella marina TaxID=2683284 RepID=A0A6P1T5F9_9RHOB|nr:alpha/beta hydrolase [Algicella marina]QHQ37031.1 hypothetical protein GO499_18505 [Algicella marina]